MALIKLIMFEMLFSIIIFAGVFSFLVVMHELGHYLTARTFGVGVSEFAVGFGNLVFSYKDKTNTQWSLRSLPFGGYVAILDEEHPEVKGKTINQASYWQKLIIFIGGPIANILTAFALTIAVVFFAGYQPTPTNIVATSKIDGIKAGDKIISIDGMQVQNWKDVQINLTNKSQVLVAVERETNNIELINIEAEKVEEQKKLSLLGKAFSGIAQLVGYKTSTTKTTYKWNFEAAKPTKEVKSFVESITKAFSITIDSILEFFTLLYIVAINGVSMLAGPIGIAKSLSSAASMGVEALTLLTIKLSMSLGLFNLLPLPMLDGGQILLATLSKIKGKALSNRFLTIWGYSGLALIGGLMIYISFMDIIK